MDWLCDRFNYALCLIAFHLFERLMTVNKMVPCLVILDSIKLTNNNSSLGKGLRGQSSEKYFL